MIKVVNIYNIQIVYILLITVTNSLDSSMQEYL